MTQGDHAVAPQRWRLITVAITLALCLLVVSILDYALGAHSTVIVAAALLLLGLLSFLLARIYQRGRGRSLSVAFAPAAEISTSTAFLVLLALMALATVLRLYRLGHESFWYDETWTATWAAQPLGDVLRLVNPLPHLVAHLSLSLGRSEFVLRLAPAFAGILLIPATYLLGRTLYGRKQGLVAAGILTVSAYAIYHSQELRFYAWQMLFSTLTLYFLLRGLEHGHWLDWVGFSATTALNLHSHPYALFVLASEGLYALGIVISDAFASHKGQPFASRHRLAAIVRRLIPPGIAALVALVAFGPGWGHVASLSHNPDWTSDTEAAVSAVGGTSPLTLPIATWTYELPSRLLALQHPLLLFAMFALFFIGLLSSSRRLVALVLVWFLVPPAILLLVKVRFFHRYLSYFLPLFTIVVAHGIGYVASIVPVRPQRRWLIIALLTLLVVTPSLAQLPEYYQDTQKTQWREVISFVEANRQPGDVALVTLNSNVGAAQQPFDWYRTVPATELPWQFFPKEGTLTDPEQLRELPALTQNHQRIWFVLPEAATDTQEQISEALQERFRLQQVQEFVHLRVVLYEAVTSGRLPPDGPGAETCALVEE